MKCPACGSASAPIAAVCHVCWTPLKKQAPAARPSPAVRAPVPAAPWTPYLAGAALLFLLMAPLRGRLMSLLRPLDFVNLAFHEGGHVLFGLPGWRFLMVAGGTAMQLLLPAAAVVHFLKRSERLSAWVCLFWVGQNLLGIGHYAADARAQLLDLVAGGVHDWTYLLECAGLLRHDAGIGAGIQIGGCAVMAVSVAGAARELCEKRQA